MNEKWYKSVVVLLGTIMLLVQAITMVYMVGMEPEQFSQTEKLVQSFIAVAMIGLSISFMVLGLRRKKAGPIIGMIVGLEFAFLNFNVANLIIGATLFVFCLCLLVTLEKSETGKEKTEKAEKKEEAEA